MRKICLWSLVFSLWSLVFFDLASASYISLNTTLTSKVEKNELKVMVSTINKGDESAYNVRAEIKMGGKEILSDKEPELPVNGIYRANFSVPLSLGKPGTYPLILIMHYTDANQYPFSALTVQTFAYGKEAPSPLFGQAKSTSFSKEGWLRLTLKNLGDREIKANTYLVAPRELTVEEEKLSLSISPKSEQSTRFRLKNFSALNGSTYQLFAVSEFEDQGLHHTSVAPGTVKIVAAQEIFGLSYTAIFIILGALLIIFVGSQFFRKK